MHIHRRVDSESSAWMRMSMAHTLPVAAPAMGV